jgi:hypothetical protein
MAHWMCLPPMHTHTLRQIWSTDVEHVDRLDEGLQSSEQCNFIIYVQYRMPVTFHLFATQQMHH